VELADTDSSKMIKAKLAGYKASLAAAVKFRKECDNISAIDIGGGILTLGASILATKAICILDRDGQVNSWKNRIEKGNALLKVALQREADEKAQAAADAAAGVTPSGSGLPSTIPGGLTGSTALSTGSDSILDIAVLGVPVVVIAPVALALLGGAYFVLRPKAKPKAASSVVATVAGYHHKRVRR
jgi:hypothetical protein